MKEEPWLDWRMDDDAVSPVIAVILMVAITVVLAAVVYTWASGLAGTSGQGGVQGACSQGSGNFVRISSAPGRSVDRTQASYRMTDSNGNVYTGQQGDDGVDIFAYNWSGTTSNTIDAGDVFQVSDEPSNDPWSKNEALTFEVFHQGDAVLSCPFKWQE